jgi:hypothetical protein
MASTSSKKFDIAGMIRHHFESAKMALLSIPIWVALVPVLLCIVILLIRQTPIGWFTEKPVQELAAPVVIGLTAGLALIVHYWLREFFTLLLACFVWALFLRELHFVGTSTGLYISIILLAWWASSRRDEIRDFVKWPSIRALLSCSIWTYFVTKLFDRHYFSFLPYYNDWNNNVEESLETIAHVMVFALVVVTLRIGSLRGQKGTRKKKKTR